MEPIISSEVRGEKVNIHTPGQLFDEFYQNEEYKKGYSTFFEGKKLADDVTEEEKNEVFLSSELAVTNLFTFVRKSIKLTLDSDSMTDETKRAIEDYKEHVRYIKKHERELDRDQIMSLDQQRSGYHRTAGDKLYIDPVVNKNGKRVIPSSRMAKAFVSAMLVQEGLDTYASVSEPESKRVERQLGVYRK